VRSSNLCRPTSANLNSGAPNDAIRHRYHDFAEIIQDNPDYCGKLFLGNYLRRNPSGRESGEAGLLDRGVRAAQVAQGFLDGQFRHLRRQGKIAVVYEVVGGGSVVMERLFQGQPHEMVSMYHPDGKHLVMTHHCAARNQPRMKAGQITADRIDFDFAGGSNFDPAKDSHMHNGYIEWKDADQIQGKWFGWANGKPSDHAVGFDLERIKPAKP